MDFNFSKVILNRLDKLFEGSTEQSIDAEITLPDYYPEVSTVHCCNAFAVIQNRQCTNETVSIGGQVNLNVIYSDSQGGINLFEYAVPFNKSVDAKCNVDGMNAAVTAKINYINHRAVAPRKLEIHGSANLNIVCEDLRGEEILSETDEPDIYLKTETFECLEPISTIRKLTYVEDDISVGNNPCVERILRTAYYAYICECKFVNSKAVLKGNLDVEIVYFDQEGTTHKLTRQQGFSQIVECDDVNDGTACRASAEVISFETRLKSTNEGENRLVGFEAKVEVKLECANKREFTAVCDAFSGQCKIMADYKTVSVVKSIDSLEETFVCNKNFELPESGGNVIDSWCTVANKHCAIDEGKLVVKGDLNICVLYMTVSGNVAYYVKPVDFDYRCELGGDFSGEAEATVCIKAFDFTTGKSSDASAAAEVQITIQTKQIENIKVLADISKTDGECKNIGSDTAVVLYFAENESVWEIAKKYGVCPEKILKINGEQCFDSKCNKIMLIPNC